MELLVARRYLFSPHARSVVNLISGLSVAAVAIPVAAMIILLSVFNGFEGLIRGMYTSLDADLTLSPRKGVTFAVEAVDSAALRGVEGVEALSFILEQSALLEHEGRQATALVRGVDDNYAQVLPMSGESVRGDGRVRLGDLDRLVMGESMAYLLGIRTLADADVTLYAVRRGGFSSLLPMANYRTATLPVVGLFSLDMESEQRYLFTSLRRARELFQYPDKASSLLIRLAEGASPERVREAVGQVVGEEFEVQTREELRSSFYRIMRYEKWGIFFIALMVLCIASFSVVGALSMLIVEKRKERQTLRALGASTQQIRRIFRYEGYLICGWGALIGVGLGVALSLIQQHFGLLEIPAESFLMKSYPVEFRWEDLGAVLLSLTLVAWILARVTVHSMIKKSA